MALPPGLTSLNGVSWKLYLFMDYFDDKEENLKGVSDRQNRCENSLEHSTIVTDNFNDYFVIIFTRNRCISLSITF